MGFLDGVLGSVVGGVFGLAGQEEANEANEGINSAQMAFNQAEARENRVFNQYEADQSRRWQEAMASTSFQRAVGDLKAAGLNPMLAYQQGGAKVPSGATGTGSAGNAGSQIAMQNSNQAAINGAMAAAQVENVKSQTDVNKAQKEKIEAEVPQTMANTGNIKQQTEVLKETIPKIKAEIDEINSRSGVNISTQTLNGYKYDLTKTQTQLEEGRISLTEAQKEVQQTLNKLYQYDIPEARNRANYQNKEMPSAVSPALRDLGAIINGVGQMRGMAR